MTWGVDERAYETTTKFYRMLLRTGMAQAFGWALREVPRPFYIAGVVWSMGYAATHAEKIREQTFEANDLWWETPGVGLILLGLLLRVMIIKAAKTAHDVAQSQINVNTDKVY